MVYLGEIFPLDLFQQRVSDKYVRIQAHPDDADLKIANYAEKTQYERAWDEVTRNCRGLIYRESTGEVVARAFSKFWNWDESGQPYPPTGTVIRAPKMDGSLGILYDGDPSYAWAIATRGSFASEQAARATDMFHWTRARVDEYVIPMEGKTYLFEIIYPENRIVVDYGDDEKLVLLDVIDNATGRSDLDEFDAFPWPHKVEKKLLKEFDPVLFATDIPEGEEGWVLYWPGKDFRVKMKSADYVHLHRLIFGLNARTVWDTLSQGKSLSTLMDGLPDEFHAWVIRVGMELQSRYAEKKSDIGAEYRKYSHFQDRKAFAMAVKNNPLKSYMFLAFDGSDDKISAAIWKDIRPRHDEFQLVSQTEDTA